MIITGTTDFCDEHALTQSSGSYLLVAIDEKDSESITRWRTVAKILSNRVTIITVQLLKQILLGNVMYNGALSLDVMSPIKLLYGKPVHKVYFPNISTKWDEFGQCLDLAYKLGVKESNYKVIVSFITSKEQPFSSYVLSIAQPVIDQFPAPTKIGGWFSKGYKSFGTTVIGSTMDTFASALDNYKPLSLDSMEKLKAMVTNKSKKPTPKQTVVEESFFDDVAYKQSLQGS